MATVSGDHPSTAEPQQAGRQPSNLVLRTVTILIVVPLALALVYAGGWVFALAIIALAAVGAAEFYLLAHGQPTEGSALIGIPAVVLVALSFQLEQAAWSFAILLIAVVLTFVIRLILFHRVRLAAAQALMTGAGILYLGYPAGFLIAIRNQPDGLVALILVLALTWGTDTLAYIGGRLFGRHKLAPRISPKKTVEGAIVGYFGGFISSLIILWLAGWIAPVTLFIIIVGPVVAIAGDLLESWMKRRFGAKDSHLRGFNIFPGHGGVLDRVDALIVVTVFCFFSLLLFGLL